MTTLDIATVEQAWTSLAPVLFVPHSEHEYRCLMETLDLLIDTVGQDESHPLASLMEVIGALIENYEDAEEKAPEGPMACSPGSERRRSGDPG
jgi:HTH-type transcriptional regulator / antitoxin HigA